MKKKSAITSFVLIIIFALISAFLTFFSFRIPFTNYRWNSFAGGMSFGGDISDGVCTKYSISYSGDNVNAKNLVKERIYDVLNDYYSQPNVYLEGDSTLYIEIGSDKNFADDERVENALSIIGDKTEFKIYGADEEAESIGVANIKSAYYQNLAGTDVLVAVFDKEGATLLKTISGTGIVNIQLSEGNVYPNTTEQEIVDGKIYMPMVSKAGVVATLVNLTLEKESVTLTYSETKNITAGLGDRIYFVFLTTLITLAVCFIIFFAVKFRLLGVFVLFPLAIFVGIYTFLLNTLPSMHINAGGLFGIALSAIFYLVITFAYLIEAQKQVREGKSVINGLKGAFSKIMKNVFDFSLALAVPLTVLIFLGSSAINNFAVCMIVGLATSMFVSLVVLKAGVCAVSKIFEKHVAIIGLDKKEADHE